MTRNRSHSQLPGDQFHPAVESGVFPFEDLSNNPIFDLLNTFDSMFSRIEDGLLGKVPVFDLFVAPGRDYPKMNVYRDKTALYIEAAVPGFRQEEINILIKDNWLLLSGKKEKKEKNKGKEQFMRNIATRSFERKIGIPSKDIDVDNIRAEMEDGILSIALPILSIEKTSFKIEINKDSPEPEIIDGKN